MIAPSQLGIEIPTKQNNVKQARIIPRSGFYIMEVVYEQEPKHAGVDPLLVAGIDIGLNNVATLTSNKAGFTPLLVNGRPLKHINQWYNKECARLQCHLSKHKRHTSTRLERLTQKRTRKIDHYLHTQSHRIIEHLVEEGIGTVVIGKNDGWKQEINIGKRNNQQFVQIPFARFIDMLN
nr:transposase [Ktedonobacter racemifer]